MDTLPVPGNEIGAAAGLDAVSLAPAGIDALAIQIRRRIPDIVRDTASNELFQVIASWMLLLILWGLYVVISDDGGSSSLTAYVIQTLVTGVLLIGGAALCWLRYRRSWEHYNDRWQLTYGRVDYELRATGLPVLIADLDVWEQILAVTDDSLLSTFVSHRVKGAEDCLLHACAYWGALHEYMFGSELVQPKSVWDGHRLRSELGRGSGQRYNSVELLARLAAICDYFSADLEVMPPPREWRDFFGLVPLSLQRGMEERMKEAQEADAWLAREQQREADSQGPGW